MIKKIIDKLFRQGTKYLRVVKWLFGEAFLTKFWGDPFFIFLFSGMRLACQAAGISILYFYANALKSDGRFAVFQLDFPARESSTLMWLIIISTFIMFALASLFQYFARIKSISLASHYEKNSSEQALRIVSRLPDPRTPTLNETLRKGDYRKIPGDARRTGMIVRSIGYTVPQVFTGVCGGALILLIDPLLSAGLGLLTLCVFFGQYPANLRGAFYSQEFEKNIIKTNFQTTKLFKYFIDTLDVKKNDEVIDQYFRNKGVHLAITSFAGRLRVIEESTLITQIGSALVISFTVFVIGQRLLSGGYNWGLLLTYLASLRACLGGVVQTGRSLTGVSRFYFQLVRFHDIIKARKYFESKASGLKTGEMLVLKISGVDKTSHKIDLEAFNKFAFYTLDRIDRTIFHVLNFANIVDTSGSSRAFKNKALLLNNYDELVKRIGRNNKLNDDDVDVIFIENELLSQLPSALKTNILNSPIVLIIYKDIDYVPVNKEKMALFYSDCELFAAIDLSKQNFNDGVSKLIPIIDKIKNEKESATKNLDTDMEDDF